MKSYTTKLREFDKELKDFVDPLYITPSNMKSKIPNPIYSLLTDKTPDLENGALGILLAEAGQGKTYSTQYLASLIASTNHIPIYIHSSQWKDMREDELFSIYKTITQSFRYFGASIDWIEDIEEDFINIALKLDLFRIIFDGFDEYIFWNKGEIDANSVIDNLYKMAIESKSKIIVTSRTTFWESNITDEDKWQYLYKYSIEPFDTNHAKNYFIKRFPGKPKSINKAVDLFGKLRQNTFAGRGFVLSLIADLCSDSTDLPPFDKKSSVSQWIMHALCHREVIRQKLPLDANEQISILSQLAEFKAIDDELTTEIIRIVISSICENLTMRDIENLVGKDKNSGTLSDHPLIFKKPRSDEWEFKQEQVRFNLLAELILSYSIKKNYGSIKRFFKKIKFKGSLLDDLTVAIHEQLSNIQDYENHYKTFIISLLKCVDLKSSSSNNSSNIILLATKLLLNLLNLSCPIGKPKEDRTKKLLSYVPSLKGLQFTGTLSSLDFSEMTIDNCRFDNVVFTNCRFNPNTIFSNSKFMGGYIHNCKQIGKAQFIDCKFDNEADATFSYLRMMEGEKRVTKLDVQRDVELFIKKFVPREGIFKLVKDQNILKGPLGLSPHKKTLLEIMEKHIIEKHPTYDDSFKIKTEVKPAILYFYNNNRHTGELSTVLNELCKKLKVTE